MDGRHRAIHHGGFQGSASRLIREEGLWYIDEMYVTDEAPAPEERRL